jgi:hypothetical protein
MLVKKIFAQVFAKFSEKTMLICKLDFQLWLTCLGQPDQAYSICSGCHAPAVQLYSTVAVLL